MNKIIRTLILIIVFVGVLVTYKTAVAQPDYGKLPLGVYWSYHDATFQKIAWCESRHDLQARNSSSSAKGEFQFLDGTWEFYGIQYWGDEFKNKDVLSLDNRELAWYVYQKYGTRDWEADSKSHKCWG